MHSESTMCILFHFITAEQVKKKLDNLRTQYTRERAKGRNIKSGSGAGAVPVSKWWLLPKLSFLDSFVVSRKTVSNINNKVQYMSQDKSPLLQMVLLLICVFLYRSSLHCVGNGIAIILLLKFIPITPIHWSLSPIIFLCHETMSSSELKY